jgi:hypothetical protein
MSALPLTRCWRSVSKWHQRRSRRERTGFLPCAAAILQRKCVFCARQRECSMRRRRRSDATVERAAGQRGADELCCQHEHSCALKRRILRGLTPLRRCCCRCVVFRAGADVEATDEHTATCARIAPWQVALVLRRRPALHVLKLRGRY